jgi:hypothetical protein
MVFGIKQMAYYYVVVALKFWALTGIDGSYLGPSLYAQQNDVRGNTRS